MTTQFIFQAVYSLGQLLDLIGAIILFRYGLPPYMVKWGSASFTVNHDAREKTDQYENRSKWGFRLLVVGFALQFSQSLYYLWLYR